MRRVPALAVLAAILALAGCSNRSPSPPASSSPPPSSSPSAADLPPVWVQSEAMWQSLAAGDPHPRLCQWLYVEPARAAGLRGSATSYLRLFRSMGKAYVVVVHGHFTPDGGQTAAAALLYLVLIKRPDDHYYLAHGFATSSIYLARLGRVHVYVPQLPLHAGVWGHTMFVGGPFPGGPAPIAHVDVAVWKGDRVPRSGQPLRRLRSDADGFFALDLPPGIYTFTLTATDHGWPLPDTVSVGAGQPAAAGVYGEAP
jgi:hypothetical protein